MLMLVLRGSRVHAHPADWIAFERRHGVRHGHGFGAFGLSPIELPLCEENDGVGSAMLLPRSIADTLYWTQRHSDVVSDCCQFIIQKDWTNDLSGGSF